MTTKFKGKGTVLGSNEVSGNNTNFGTPVETLDIEDHIEDSKRSRQLSKGEYHNLEDQA